MGDRLRAADGVAELLLHPPLAPHLRRDGQFPELFISPLAAQDLVEGRALQADGPVGAENPEIGAGLQTGHGAPAEVGLGPAGHLAQDVDVVGHRHRLHDPVLVAAPVGEHLGHGGNAGGGTHVPHDSLIPDAHAQDVVAAQSAVLPPVQRRFGVDEGVGPVAAAVVVADPQPHRQDFAQVTVGDIFLHGRVDLQGLGGGHYLGDQVRELAGGVQHVVGLLGVHGHAGFGQYVLVGFQGGQHQVAVHVRPGADADGVDAVVFHQLQPVVVDLGDFVLARDAFTRLPAPVGHGDDLHSGLFPETGNVSETGVGPGADQPYSDQAVFHMLPPAVVGRCSF